jgi:hypothetical protein
MGRSGGRLFRRPKLTPSCSAERKEGRKYIPLHAVIFLLPFLSAKEFQYMNKVTVCKILITEEF